VAQAQASCNIPIISVQSDLLKAFKQL